MLLEIPAKSQKNALFYFKQNVQTLTLYAHIKKGGALGYTRNRKTEEKFIQNRKTASKIGQNRKPHTKLNTQIGPNRNKK